MPDLMQYIVTKHSIVDDPHGNLMSLEDWNAEKADAIANTIGISLTKKHLQIVQEVRNFYRDNAPCNQARKILKVMEASVDSERPRKYLYQLFPGGPVQQACKIGGLPVPADCNDLSFGTSQ